MHACACGITVGAAVGGRVLLDGKGGKVVGDAVAGGVQVRLVMSRAAWYPQALVGGPRATMTLSLPATVRACAPVNTRRPPVGTRAYPMYSCTP